jgi:hypothetical protein
VAHHRGQDDAAFRSRAAAAPRRADRARSQAP